MRHPLTPDEQAALRRLADQLSQEDPGLASRLRRGAGGARRGPAAWLYLVVGTAFLLAGMMLDVGSAVLGGLVSLGIAALRHPGTRAWLRDLAGRRPH